MKLIKYNILTNLIEHGNNKNYVRYRVTCMGKRVDLYTGIVVSRSDWNSKNDSIKQGKYVGGIPYNLINTDLREKENFIREYFNECVLRNALPELNELKDRYNHRFRHSPEQSSNDFYYLFDQFIETASQTFSWKKSMIEKYKRIRERLYKFNPNLSFLDLSETTMNGIIKEFSRTMYDDALEKTFFCLKRFVKWAQAKYYPVNNEFFSYKPKLSKVHKSVRYLTPEDLNKLKSLPLPQGSAMDMTRDFFLFQCGTALRYSDLKQLKKSNILEANGVYSLKKLTEKDDDIVYIPLSHFAKEIYLKYCNNEYEDNVLFPVLSNQKYNKHLKELGEMAEFEGEWIDYEYRLNEKIEIKTPKKDLTSHTARRTFVVTAYNEGVPLDLIALVTSHSDMKAMRPYLKATPKGSQMAVDAFDRATAIL